MVWVNESVVRANKPILHRPNCARREGSHIAICQLTSGQIGGRHRLLSTYLLGGGRCVVPGMGLALGGGIGLSMRQHGLTCDNILAAQIVIANGSLVSNHLTAASANLWLRLAFMHVSSAQQPSYSTSNGC